MIEGYQLFEIESLLAQLQPLFVKHETVIKEVSKIITQNTQHDVQVSRLILTVFLWSVLKVLSANESEADDEIIFDNDAPQQSPRLSSQWRRGNMSSVSGADDSIYMEFKRTTPREIKHPLFKRFRR